MNYKHSALCLLLAMSLSNRINAKIQLSPLFTSGMVMQQQTQAPVWGLAKAGATVAVTTSWNGQTYSTTADDTGHWQLSVATPSAGGPYSVTISEGRNRKNAVTLTDVLIGEVWLCSGQSNMEMPVEGWGKVMNYQQEEQEANQYPQIRLLQVKKNTSPVPLTDFEANTRSTDGRGGWQRCSAESVAEFSATAYFFGRNLHQTLRVPIGLIDTSWGGTFIEPWTSREMLANHPDMQAGLDDVAAMAPTVEGRRQQFNQKVAAWQAKEIRHDEGWGRYATPDYDDADWLQVNIPKQWEQLPGWADVDGVVWMRRTIDIPKQWAGQPLTISLGRVDDMDYTFFNGTQVGATYEFGLDRFYTVPAHLVKTGKNTITVRVIDTGGGGGIYSDASQLWIAPVKAKPSAALSLAGEWRMKHTTDLSALPIAPVNDATSPNKVTLLFNAMVNPLIPFAIKGTIWYQGCNNERRGYEYRELLPMLIADWRSKWAKDFPFYVVQLANYQALQTQPGDDLWAEVREAQDMATRHVAHSGLACTIDIGDAGDIHPKNKQEVGRRLSLIARKDAYQETLEASGPHYEGYTLEGSAVRIRLSHASGLRTSDGSAPKGFAIAGPDRQWHWADARIEGSTIVVSSHEVPTPVAVRYAWAKNPICNLQNDSGLPAVPFRTDDWPGLSINTRNDGPVLR